MRPTPFFVCLCLALTSAIAAADDRFCNVVLIVADDLGFADLGCYGSEDIRSPNLDRLARQGVRFTRFYANAPECTPTRTALLTGRYQQRAGGLECAIGLGNVGRYEDAIRLDEAGQLGLPPSQTLLPGIFGDHGYATAMMGKWHLGEEAPFHPNRHGFDLFIGPLGGAVDYFHHTEPRGVFLGTPIAGDRDFYRNTTPVDRGGTYLTSLISEEAAAWIENRKSGEPFFLYLPYTAPHDPHQGPGDYRDTQLTTEEWSRGSRETYVEMVEALDHGVGRVLAALQENGFADQTLVIFFSDNGPARHGDDGELRGKKGQLFEGGIRVPCIARWPGRLPAGETVTQTAISMDLTASLVHLLDDPTGARETLDGIDILGHVATGRPDFPRLLFWRKKRGTTTWKAARDGDLKFVLKHDSSPPSSEEYLFDLAADPHERINLSTTRPAELQDLKAKLARWEQSVKAER